MEAIASIDRIARDARAASRTMGQIHALVKQASLDKREASIPDLISEAVRLVLEDPNMYEVTTQCHCDSVGWSRSVVIVEANPTFPH